jgi:cellulose synthase/poly-beta-1,6-N-acetylglucosamine synthase-like glycosyltransferase
MVKDGDTSGKGSISFEEFLSMFEDKMKKMDSPEDIARAFECFDPFGKGFIPAKEFQNLMTTGGYAKFKDTEVSIPFSNFLLFFLKIYKFISLFSFLSLVSPLLSILTFFFSFFLSFFLSFSFFLFSDQGNHALG